MAEGGGEKPKAGSAYDSLSRSQLIALLKKRDADRKLGLVWERDEIDADRAIDDNFVVADLVADQCARPAPWDNLIIEGDNYDALRWLRMTHRGQVKCIYIDPPYNTGNKDWVYNDSYVDPNHRYRHSQWLEFLYRRLLIARDLMAPDGVLLCSINDENRAKLELMLDQALPGMRLGSLVWRTRDSTSAKDGNFSDVHEHILAYSQPGFSFTGSTKSDKKYSNPDQDPRGIWNTDPITLGFSRTERPNLFYPICNPDTGRYYPCDPDSVWRYATEANLKDGAKVRTSTIEQFIADGRIVFPRPETESTFFYESRADLDRAIEAGAVPVTPKKRLPLLRRDTPDLDFWVGKEIGSGRPTFKKFWTDLQSHISPLSSWIARKNENNDSADQHVIVTSGAGEGTGDVQSVFGSKAFPNPKPVSLIRELVRQSTSLGDLVLDFFAGSATTAQAVMELNAEDNGDRRWIMVSSTEATADAPDKNICRDVTAERVRRLNASADRYADLSAGFAYLRCREINPLELDEALTPEAVWPILEAHHGLPLTAWEAGAPAVAHEGEAVTLVLADRWSKAAAKRIERALAGTNPVFLYAFEPGQITGLTSAAPIEVRGVLETLRRLYAA